MEKLIIRSDNTKLEMPNTKNLEITKDALTLTLSFNGKGGFSLTHNGEPFQYYEGGIDDHTYSTESIIMAMRAVANTQKLSPGTVMADGTVYAGISPDTGKAFYAAAQDAPKPLEWADAQRFARESTAHGHKDWRVPTSSELHVLFNNRAAIGGFNESGSFPAGWYWSSSENFNYNARFQGFSDGSQYGSSKLLGLSVRCVRG